MVLYVRLFLCSIIWVVLSMPTKAQVTVTKRDSLIHDANNNMAANPGDSLRYKTKVKNTSGGTVDADAFDVSPSANLSLPANVRTTPVAVDDAYGVTGNVGIMVDSMNGLKINDFDDDYEGATIMPEIKMSNQSGDVTINDDGSFTYVPPAGYTGLDTFTYTLLDGNPLPECPDENDGTVILTIADMIIFIDNSSVAATSDGRLTSPFKSLADFNSGSPAASPVVYVENTGTNYTGGIVLQDNERLFGEGHTGAANLAGVLPFALAMHSLTLPNINGTRPVITNGGGDGVTLAMHNTLRGFNVGNCSDFGIENSGTNSVGNLVVSEVSISNGTGGGFDASHGSGASTNVVFTSLSSTGGTNGINLTNCAGTFTVNGGTITNPTGTGVLISGGSVVFSTSGAITDNTGFAVDVDNHDNGNVTFSGNVTSTGTGIRVQNCGGGTKLFSGTSKSLTTTTNNGVTLSSNTGATISFTNGGLVIITTSGVGFNATGGGTVNVTGSGNTINSTSATALNVTNTSIGGSNLNFLSISSGNNTAAADPANGIVLNDTGSSGGLTVTGTGGAGTGGTIQSCTSTGISGSTTFNLNLSYMNIANNGNAVGEHGIELSQLTGSGSMTGCSVSGSSEHNMRLVNTSGTLTAFNVTASAFTTTSIVTGGDGFLLENNGSGSMTVSITGCTFTDNKGDHFQAATTADATGTTNITFSNNTLTTTPANDPNVVGGGITISPTGSSDMNYTISNNNIQQAFDEGININLGTASTPAASLIGTISNNVIGTPDDPDSGCESGTCISVVSNGAGVSTVAISGNQAYEYANPYGIFLSTKEGSSNLNATVTGNTVKNPGSFALNGIRIDAGATAGDNGTLCIVLSGNDVTGSGLATEDIRLRQRFNTTIVLPGYGGVNNDTGAVNAFVAANNDPPGATPPPTVSSAHNVGGGGGGFIDGPACQMP